jgi:hypothetical protein
MKKKNGGIHMKKALKVLGWIFIPYIMIFIFWKRLQKSGRIAGIIYSAFIIFSGIFNGNATGNTTASPKQEVKKADSQQVAADEAKKKEESKKKADEQSKKDAAAATQKKAEEEAAAKKKADEEAAAKKKAADEKATQQAELAALGDWSIKSNSYDFENRYTQIQKYIAQGDKQSAYDEATMASKRADDLNSKTMNNQDMDNVPTDIPSDVRNILSGVDPLLATGYMSEKDGFDKLADAINTNDLAKLNEAKDDFAVANDQFNQAKALIDKANNALK